MSDDALLFVLPERHPRLGAALAAVGELECAGTPAVRGWLQAHGVPASSEYVRIVPAGAEVLIPEDAERLPVPLSEEETVRVEHACAPPSVTDIESELLTFRDTTQDWRSLVHRALTSGIPAPRIAQLTGLDPQDIVQAVGGPSAAEPTG
ncbi:DUF6003 family protein [Streptomyces phaeoluteigriseus]|uniref:DUF6003 family protein n=1 Tax=Streptomyces phaeoluteigriseus TaxID=114686 RepID=A0ABY4Z6K6_9ACTN|nr:DUF6003 family protein [Streptomyces phaeoluteigriseus]USQ84688.1 DUF6003 family protein [Streptomyces phaeoluteigriseus]